MDFETRRSSTSKRFTKFSDFLRKWEQIFMISVLIRKFFLLFYFSASSEVKLLNSKSTHKWSGIFTLWIDHLFAFTKDRIISACFLELTTSLEAPFLNPRSAWFMRGWVVRCRILRPSPCIFFATFFRPGTLVGPLRVWLLYCWPLVVCKNAMGESVIRASPSSKLFDHRRQESTVVMVTRPPAPPHQQQTKNPNPENKRPLPKKHPPPAGDGRCDPIKSSFRFPRGNIGKRRDAMSA